MRRGSNISPEQRCTARLQDTVYNRKWTDGRCAYHRHFRINGKDLCARHAALEALSVAIKAGSAQALPHPPHPPQLHKPEDGVEVVA